MSNPTAGTGTPLKENCWELSKLNLPRRYAAAQAIINAGSNQIIETSRPVLFAGKTKS